MSYWHIFWQSKNGSRKNSMKIAPRKIGNANKDNCDIQWVSIRCGPFSSSQMEKVHKSEWTSDFAEKIFGHGSGYASRCSGSSFFSRTKRFDRCRIVAAPWTPHCDNWAGNTTSGVGTPINHGVLKFSLEDFFPPVRPITLWGLVLTWEEAV